MSELQRWRDVVAANMAAHPERQVQMPGYLAPDPLATITVPDIRAGVGGGGSSIYWSFQASLQRRVQGLVGSFASQGMPDDLVRELLNQTADDAVAWLGEYDADIANRDALVEEYVQLYRFGVTPI